MASFVSFKKEVIELFLVINNGVPFLNKLN